MYIRWKRKYRKRRCYESIIRSTLSAVLVKSVREYGKVKQNFILHLGSIREERIESSIHRSIFWRKVTQRLNKLDLGKEDISSIILKLQQVVPPPNEEDPSIERASELRKRLKVTADSKSICSASKMALAFTDVHSVAKL
jgi:hypothetical protein